MNKDSVALSDQFFADPYDSVYMSGPKRLHLDLEAFKNWKISGSSGTSGGDIEDISLPWGTNDSLDIDLQVDMQSTSIDYQLVNVFNWLSGSFDKSDFVQLPGSRFDFDLYPFLIDGVDLSDSVLEQFTRDDKVDDVLSFCQDRGIEAYYSMIPDLLKNCFKELKSVHFNLEEDDESEEIFIEILCSVSGSSDCINQSYDSFLDYWVEEVPAEARAFFRLLLDIVV